MTVKCPYSKKKVEQVLKKYYEGQQNLFACATELSIPFFGFKACLKDMGLLTPELEEQIVLETSKSE